MCDRNPITNLYVLENVIGLLSCKKWPDNDFDTCDRIFTYICMYLENILSELLETFINRGFECVKNCAKGKLSTDVILPKNGGIYIFHLTFH